MLGPNSCVAPPRILMGACAGRRVAGGRHQRVARTKSLMPQTNPRPGPCRHHPAKRCSAPPVRAPHDPTPPAQPPPLNNHNRQCGLPLLSWRHRHEEVRRWRHGGSSMPSSRKAPSGSFGRPANRSRPIKIKSLQTSLYGYRGLPMQPTRPYHGPNYGARSSAIQQHQNHTIHTTRAPETVLTMPTMAT